MAPPRITHTTRSLGMGARRATVALLLWVLCFRSRITRHPFIGGSVRHPLHPESALGFDSVEPRGSCCQALPKDYSYKTAPSAVRRWLCNFPLEPVARLPPRPSRLSEPSGSPLLMRVPAGAIAALIAAAHVWSLIDARRREGLFGRQRGRGQSPSRPAFVQSSRSVGRRCRAWPFRPVVASPATTGQRFVLLYCFVERSDGVAHKGGKLLQKLRDHIPLIRRVRHIRVQIWRDRRVRCATGSGRLGLG